MTYLKDVYGQNVQLFDKYFVGSDRMFKQLKDLTETTKTLTNYPPYNIKKVDENKYVIELAVAGFGKQDIDITLEDNKLVIKGKISGDPNGDYETSYLHKGIADRGFTRQFTLADNVEINNANLINGMLKVWLEHVIPESKKPKKIDIVDDVDTVQETKKSSKKQFLSE
jgi:molecular chaperone IbpA